MKKIFAIAATAAALTATPAFANEGYVSGRVSYDSAEVDADDLDIDVGSGVGFGVGAGYDFDLGEKAFIGAEVGVDFSTASKRFVDADLDIDQEFKTGREFSAVGRLGFKASNKIKVYGLAGYVNGKFTSDDGFDEVSDTGNGVVFGAGLSANFGEKVLGSLEYRRSSYNVSDEDGEDLGDLNKSRIMASVGIRF